MAEMLTLRDTYGFEPEGFEGHLSQVPAPGAAAFHRLLGPGGHLYTSNLQEVQDAVSKFGYKDEGICGFIATTQLENTTALYRMRHAGIPTWFYEVNKVDRDDHVAHGWVDEGIAGYVWMNPDSGTIQEQFYDKDEQVNWWAEIGYKDGDITVGGGFHEDWHHREYRVGADGYTLTSFKAVETTKNNNADWKEWEYKGSHYVLLAVADKAPFGAGNWVGVRVIYGLSRTYAW